MESPYFELDKEITHLAQRVMKLDSLYLEIQLVSGYTVEQMLDMFLAGYTMNPPQYEPTTIADAIAAVGEKDGEN